MPGGTGDGFDYFLSRRGSVAAVAREVADVLAEKGYTVYVQDYDIPAGASFIEAMHEAIKNARDLVILFTGDYEASTYTRKEFTSFEAERLQGARDRHIVILRCEDVPLRGLLADNVYQDLVGVTDPEERKRRIIAAAERHSAAQRPQRRRGRTFVGVPPRIASFTGRADALDRLDAILIKDKPAAVTQIGRAAVHGLGAVGKTSLAVEYAIRFRGLYDGIWWCPAETRTGLITSLAALAAELEAAAAGEANIEKAAKAGLRRLAEQAEIWLLVYDNVVAPDEIADLLPAAGARVLITSRFSDWSGWADEVSLDVLPVEEAMAFLQDRAGRRDESGARPLAEALGGLPLALDHAAATCKRTQMSFAAYAAKATGFIAEAPRGAGYPQSVAATFGLAIDDAAAQRPEAEELMAFLAQCAPERIPMTLLEGAIGDEAERMRAVAALAEVSLLKHDPFEDGAPAVTVHRLVQAVARTRATARGGVAAAVQRIIARLEAIFPRNVESDPEGWPLCAHLMPHLLATCQQETGTDTLSANQAVLLDRAGAYFLGRGVYSRAESLFRTVLATRERLFGPHHSETARSLSNLAVALRSRADLAGARALLVRALLIQESAADPNNLATATTLNNLAGLLKEEGDLAVARPLYERALAIRTRLLGPEHADTAQSLNNLALELLDLDEPDAARPLCERAQAIKEKRLGPDHPDVAVGLNTLAQIRERQHDRAAARPLYERALAISERALGPDHPETGTALNNLAELLKKTGDLAAAKPLLMRALAIDEKTLGPEHPRTIGILVNVAHLLLAQGDRAEARRLFERAFAARQKVLGPEHLSTKTVALLLQAEHELTEQEKKFGPDHPEVATSLDKLANLLLATGDMAGTRQMWQRRLAILEKTSGPDHPDTATALDHVALALHAQDDLAGALPLYERALAIREKRLGPDQPGTATSLNNLAVLLRDKGDRAAAKPLFERALAIDEKKLGPEHQHTVNALNNLAELLRTGGDFTAARPYFERLLAIREKQLGKGHPDTVAVRNILASAVSGKPAQTDPQRMTSEAGSAEVAHSLRDQMIGCSQLGERKLGAGERDGAMNAFQAALSIARLLAAARADDWDAQRDLAVSANKLGNSKVAVGDSAGALRDYQESVPILRKLAGKDNDPWAPNYLSVVLERIGDIERHAGKKTAAREHYEESLAIARRLAQAQPESLKPALDVVSSLTHVAAVSESPLGYYQEALDIVLTLDRAGRLRPEDRPYIAQMRAAVAEASAAPAAPTAPASPAAGAPPPPASQAPLPPTAAPGTGAAGPPASWSSRLRGWFAGKE